MEDLRQSQSGLFVVENQSASYKSLASREVRQVHSGEDDGIVRGGFKKETRPVRILEGLQDEVTIPRSRHDHMMSPIELSTGVPLPILAPRGKGRSDYHHAFFYDKIYRGKLENRATRYSRLQLVSQWAHTRYHQHFDGTAYPENEHEAFKVTILNCAGYVPNYGVHVKQDELVIRPLRSNEKHALRKSQSFVTERYCRGRGEQRKSIGQFIMYYALSQQFDDMKQIEVEEFLSLTPQAIEKAPAYYQNKMEERKVQLAMKLTNSALDASVELVRPDFQRARRDDLLRRNVDARDPWRIAKAQLGDKESDYYETLEGLLSHKFGAAA